MDDGYMGSGKRLHQAYKKYGLECFIKEVMQFYTSEEELNRGEMFYIEKFNSTDPKIGYNLTYGGEGQLGREPWNKGKQHSNEYKKKMSESHKGITFTEEHKQKLSVALKGKPKSEEHRRKISECQKGRKRKPFTEEHRRKMQLAWQKRKLEKLNNQNNG